MFEFKKIFKLLEIVGILWNQTISWTVVTHSSFLPYRETLRSFIIYVFNLWTGWTKLESFKITGLFQFFFTKF